MDSLLGIGSAGGSKKKDEGKMLAKRLDAMRKERDARSKTRKTEERSKTPVMAGGPSPNMEMEAGGFDSNMDEGVVELTGSATEALRGGRPGGNPRRPKTKKKKKKNKK